MEQRERSDRIFSTVQTMILVKSLDVPSLTHEQIEEIFEKAADFVNCVEGIEKEFFFPANPRGPRSR